MSWPSPLSHLEGPRTLSCFPWSPFPHPLPEQQTPPNPLQGLLFEIQESQGVEPWAPPQPQIHSLPSLLDYFLLVTWKGDREGLWQQEVELESPVPPVLIWRHPASSPLQIPSPLTLEALSPRHTHLPWQPLPRSLQPPHQGGKFIGGPLLEGQGHDP